MGLDMTQVLNTGLNPLTTNTVTPQHFPFDASKGDNAELNRMILHVLALTGVYGLGSYAASRLGSLSKGDEDLSFEKRYKALMNAESPILSLSPTEDQAKDEEGLENVGLIGPKKRKQLEAEAAQQKTAADASVFDLSSPTKYALIAPIAAVAIAQSMADYQAKKRISLDKKKEIEGNLSSVKAKYSRLQYERLLRAKGLSDEEIQAVSAKDTANPESIVKTAAEDKPAPGTPTGQPTAGKWAIAVALAAMGLFGYAGYNMSRSYFDANDENRLRRKALLKELDTRKLTEHPTEISGVFPSEFHRVMNNQPPPKKATGAAGLTPEESDSIVQSLA